MKRIFCMLTIVALIGLCLPAQSAAQSRFTLRLAGGLNMLDGGDLNSGAEGWFKIYETIAHLGGFSTSGTFSPARLGLNFGGDFIFKFNESLGLGIGAGMLSASKKIVMTVSGAGGGSATYDIKARAIPLRLGFFYFLPVGSSINVVFNAGLGYYLGKANLKTILVGGTTETAESDASGSGLGFHGGLGMEIALTPSLGILVDLSGRFASFGGFEGKQKGDGSTVSGTLYAFDAHAPVGTYHVILVNSTKPSGVGISNSDEAKVSFTGFSLAAGFFFRF